MLGQGGDITSIHIAFSIDFGGLLHPTTRARTRRAARNYYGGLEYIWVYGGRGSL